MSTKQVIKSQGSAAILRGVSATLRALILFSGTSAETVGQQLELYQ